MVRPQPKQGTRNAHPQSCKPAQVSGGGGQRIGAVGGWAHLLGDLLGSVPPVETSQLLAVDVLLTWPPFGVHVCTHTRLVVAALRSSGGLTCKPYRGKHTWDASPV
jgi:hypothetical protein